MSEEQMRITEEMIEAGAQAMFDEDPIPMSMLHKEEIRDLARACLRAALSRIDGGGVSG